MALAPLSAGFQSLPPLLTTKLGPSGADSRVGRWACAHSRPLWVSPMNSPGSLGVSLTAASTPTGVFNQRFEALFPCPGTLGCSIYLATHLFLPVYLYANVGPPAPPASNSPGSPADALLQVLSSWLPISAPLQVWMNVSSLTPWLSDFHTVQFFWQF